MNGKPLNEWGELTKAISATHGNHERGQSPMDTIVLRSQYAASLRKSKWIKVTDQQFSKYVIFHSI